MQCSANSCIVVDNYNAGGGQTYLSFWDNKVQCGADTSRHPIIQLPLVMMSLWDPAEVQPFYISADFPCNPQGEMRLITSSNTVFIYTSQIPGTISDTLLNNQWNGYLHTSKLPLNALRLA